MNREDQLAALQAVVSEFNAHWVHIARTEADHIVISCKGIETGRRVRSAIMQAGSWALEVQAGRTDPNNRFIKVHFNK